LRRLRRAMSCWIRRISPARRSAGLSPARALLPSQPSSGFRPFWFAHHWALPIPKHWPAGRGQCRVRATGAQHQNLMSLQARSFERRGGPYVAGDPSNLLGGWCPSSPQRRRSLHCPQPPKPQPEGVARHLRPDRVMQERRQPCWNCVVSGISVPWVS